MRRDLRGNVVIFGFRNDVALVEVGGIAVRPVRDDAMGSLAVDTWKRSEIIFRGSVDIDWAFLLQALSDTLCNRLGVARGGGSGTRGSLANCVGTAIGR